MISNRTLPTVKYPLTVKAKEKSDAFLLLPAEGETMKTTVWILTNNNMGKGISLYYIVIPAEYISTSEYFDMVTDKSSSYSDLEVLSKSIQGDTGKLVTLEDDFFYTTYNMIKCGDDRFLLRIFLSNEDYAANSGNIDHIMDSFRCE